MEGLSKIIEAFHNVFDSDAQDTVIEGILISIARELDVSLESILLFKSGTTINNRQSQLRLLGGAGKNSEFRDSPLTLLDNPFVSSCCAYAVAQKSHVTRYPKKGDNGDTKNHQCCIFLEQKGSRFYGIYIDFYVDVTSPIALLFQKFLRSVVKSLDNHDKLNELYSSAYRDGLTNLPNRSDFIRYLNTSIELPKVNDLVVAIIDMQHFADVNDFLGHEVGNSLLKAVAKRLRALVSKNVYVARIGTDVFGLVGTINEVNSFNIQTVFNKPFRVSNHTLYIKVTIGLCQLNSELSNGLEIFKCCNIALNEAKRNFAEKAVWYTDELESVIVSRLNMIQRLENSFNLQQLDVLFQPKVKLDTQEVYGYEALLRWEVSPGEFISPSVFVPMAEYSGIIINIGYWVAERGVALLSKLQTYQNSDRSVAINVSMVQLQHKDFVGNIHSLFSRYNVDPSKFEIEVTESVVMNNPQHVIKTLEQLKKLGVSIALDDFGTGYSSLQYLNNLPIDRIKIDREFVDCSGVENPPVVAEMVIRLAKRLNLQTIAEGIENPQQARSLLELGCDEGQGFFFGMPQKESDVIIEIDKSLFKSLPLQDNKILLHSKHK